MANGSTVSIPTAIQLRGKDNHFFYARKFSQKNNLKIATFPNPVNPL
jgi:hypothetical protein